ncbi:ubiquitin carboxyl-terminal hydrolase 8-like isoform X2 [Amyelois transitella]|uniref:ubiquitin carboxyl-terminal hydrolase 8-like isoform X2 n=1 Tax=Amyelois transitella TaxID=680683 RepID=UPI00298F7EF6|nr:ubiquitin carboxyl-terminal hydrolase 8-like isoform X2 [Amyelois transitella]
MTETRRSLHLGKCIEDLDKLHNVPDLKTKRTTMLCKTAVKLFENAEQAREKGDEEYSYVYYMKYLRIVAFLTKDKADKAYYTSMLGSKNPNKALDYAEQLKMSLIERYAKEQKAKRLNDIKESELFKQKIEENRKKAMEVVAVSEPVILLPGPDEVTIRSEQLYSVLKSGKLKVMILDARPASAYIESHINYPACISVPEECISPGQSAHILEQSLPADSKPVWAERASMELIVLLDWNSTEVIPGNKLYLLKTILLKWDVKVQYARAPLALRGGYEEWLLRYPALCSDPRARPPPQAQPLADMLDDIEYPDWSELSPVSPPRPRAALAGRPGEPVVDRGSKAAAVQIYEERARMQSILEQQERLADTSLTLEMQRIEAEQDWEKVRVQRETEERDEMRAMYKLREQEIISQLMQLENKQYDMEQENLTLREKLEEYQRREREEAARLANSIVESQADDEAERQRQKLLSEQAAAERELEHKRARIAAVRQQRSQLDRKREMLESERKRKLQLARQKKNPNEQDEDSDAYMSSPGDSPQGALNRSQSSPNIPKIPSEDEISIPQVDRSTKPCKVAPSSEHYQRDFQPVWGDVERGLTGLKNLGNTCYMNSIIQCLNNTSILVTYFCSGQYLEHVNRSHSTRGVIAEEMAAVVRALWSGQYRFIAIKDLRNEVGKHQRAFRGCEQQDSHEFLTILMDWLHLDLQFTINAPPNKDSLPASEKAWYEYTKSKESLILQLFYGQIKSTVRCTTCGKQSVTYESFSNLSLELPANANRCSLSDCLKLYLNGETIPGWNCPNCKEKRDAVKKLDISRLPPVLVIHFKRFYVDPKEYMCNAYRKKQTYIDFPLDELDMRQFSLHCPSNHVYNLYAVSNHYGSMEGGHYTAYCKNMAYCKSNAYGKWFKFDDHVVTEIASSEVKSSAAYILFYTSCGAARLA